MERSQAGTTPYDGVDIRRHFTKTARLFSPQQNTVFGRLCTLEIVKSTALALNIDTALIVLPLATHWAA